MRLARRNRPPSVAMDMTPMIDVVFQLIIFFMTAAAMAQQEFEAMPLPEQQGKTPPFDPTLAINVNDKGQITLGGDALSLPQLEARVADAIRRKGGKADDVSVVLRVDRRLPSAVPNKVMTLLKKGGISSSRIAVEPTGGK